MQSNPLQEEKTVKKFATEIPLHFSHPIILVKVHFLEYVRNVILISHVSGWHKDCFRNSRYWVRTKAQRWPPLSAPLLSSALYPVITSGRTAKSIASSYLPTGYRQAESGLVASAETVEPARNTTIFSKSYFSSLFFNTIFKLKKKNCNTLFSILF